MTDGVNPLCTEPFVRHDPQQGRHQNRRDPQRAIDSTNRSTVKFEGDKHIGAEGGQPTSPQAELQKGEYFQLQLKIHVNFLTQEGG
ncbi:hypothetical protein SDC9_185700 [bioreactor metagenome]|uniref:Uncharacterized protein n=1 Tax=bioreactor metagenome TaxID=1076179 RepID=A0A645HHW2_9ZZZZ